MADLQISFESELLSISRMERNLLNKVLAFSGTNKRTLIRHFYQKSNDIFKYVYIFSNNYNYPDIDDRIYHCKDIPNIIHHIGKDTASDKIFIFDESVFDNSFDWKDLKNIIFNHAIYKLTIFLSIPFPSIIPNDVWRNINYTFYAPERFVRNSRQIIKMYVKNISDNDEETFVEIMDNIGRLNNHYICIKHVQEPTDANLKVMLEENYIRYYNVNE